MKALLLCLVLAGCATQSRYLTEAEDAALRAKCEPDGCAAVPIPIWNKIEQLLRSLAGRST